MTLSPPAFPTMDVVQPPAIALRIMTARPSVATTFLKGVKNVMAIAPSLALMMGMSAPPKFFRAQGLHATQVAALRPLPNASIATVAVLLDAITLTILIAIRSAEITSLKPGSIVKEEVAQPIASIWTSAPWMT